MQQSKSSETMWTNAFRTCIFFAIYQSIFNKSLGIEYKITDVKSFLETIKEEYPELFIDEKIIIKNTLENKLENQIQISKIESNIKIINEQLPPQIESFYDKMEEMTSTIQQFLSNWTKTFNIVKAILYCYLLEREATKNNEIFQSKAIAVYIKLSEEFTILANIKLIHAILAKL